MRTRAGEKDIRLTDHPFGVGRFYETATRRQDRRHVNHGRSLLKTSCLARSHRTLAAIAKQACACHPGTLGALLANSEASHTEFRLVRSAFPGCDGAPLAANLAMGRAERPLVDGFLRRSPSGTSA
jgi:hypothetical protein